MTTILDGTRLARERQGFPVVDDEGRLLGVLTRRNLLSPRTPDDARLATLITRPPIVVTESTSLRGAADLMVREKVGRLPVVAADGSGRLVGIISRSDLLAAHEQRLDETGRVAEATLWS